MDDVFAAPAASATVADGAVDPSTLPEIEHYELDGIPLYHLPTPGATTLTLAFRVGRADEPVVQGGMTHLAEHLLLNTVDQTLDHTNGTTEPFRVTFVTRGSPRDASRFLRDVCNAIETPRLSRMYEEAKVLRTEAAGRGGMGMALRLLWLRTGYQGIGTFGLPEFFLDALDETRLRDWMATNLVDGNAAIWIAGELPDDLVVSLPAGPRRPPPEQRSIEGLATPTAVMEPAPAVGVSFDVARSVPLVAGLHALRRQLVKRLRIDRGLGYDIGGDYQPVSRDRALVAVWVSCLPDAARDVQQHLLEAIDDVAARGPAPEDLSRAYQTFLRDLADPAGATGRLDGHLRDVLLGGAPEPTSVEALVDAQWRLEPEHVSKAFREARDSMLLLLPETGVDPQRPLHRYPGAPSGSVDAQRIFDFVQKENRRFRRDKAIIRLSVGASGVSVDVVDGPRLSAVLWADCVGVIRDGGLRSVLGRDGTVIDIADKEWVDGGTAIRLIDRLTPDGLAITPAPGR